MENNQQKPINQFVLIPIELEKLTSSISESVTVNILNALRNEQKPINQSEKLLNIQEAAIYLSLSVPTIYSKVSKRELSFMKRGKRLYFSQTELLEYIKTGKVKSNNEIKEEAENYLAKRKGQSNE